MATYPQFYGPDGVLRQRFVLTTTSAYRFFTGMAPSDTVDMQVSIRGASFTSDPDFITFEGTSFTLPNPSASPEGLQLLSGRNTLRLRAILSNGSVTQEAVVDAYLSLETNLGSSLDAPTGIYLERFDDTVTVVVDQVSDPTVVGYHVYASSQQGGRDTGYFRITPEMIISGETIQTETALATLTVDAPVATDSDGNFVANPLFFRVVGTQEDQADTVFATDFNELLEIPDTVRRLRVDTSIKNIVETQRFSFIHDRRATLSSVYPALPHAALAMVPDTDPLYYVATAVYLLEDGTEVESHFSPEVLGSPLRITPSLGAFPQVGRQQIVRDMVLSIYRSHPQVRVDPGSALRDTVLDPFSTEADRIRFLVDFLHNAQSFATLLLIDDPTLSGVSIPVNQSSYKTALRSTFYLASDAAVQAIIDSCFDKLASNYGVIRDGGKRARGEITFYVASQPGATITKPIGTLVSGGSMNYYTTSAALIMPSGGGRNYNPQTGRYYARAFIQAETEGVAGNLAAGQIKTISANTLNVQVINEGPTFGGTNRESNLSLATRAKRVLASVDSGTLQGYVNNATNVAGVEEVSVIEAGNALMMRDRNTDGRHVGGKVDIYLRGMSEATITDSFAFSFDVGDRIQFEPVGDPTDLCFRAVDPRLSDEYPIIEMLDLPSQGLEFEDVTQSFAFDLKDVQVQTFNRIRLSSTYNDPTRHTLGDEFRGSYRYRTSSKFILSRQPAIEVTSFSGTRTGTLVPGVYDLYRASDPLDVGRSALAGDYVQVLGPINSSGDMVPSSDPIEVSGEQLVVLDGVEYLDNLGANYLTVRVFNLDRTIEYNGPLSNSTRDFTILQGDEVTPLGFQRTDGSRITEGQTVLVDYSHDENFTVVYTTNAVVSVTQGVIDADSHITADVVVKWAVELPVDISATIVLRPNQSANEVDGRVRTALMRLFGAFSQGTPIRQADVIRTIGAVTGVAYPVVPLTKMVLGDGALVVREVVSTSTESDVFMVASWSSATVAVYLLKNALDSHTTDAGGVASEFRGVFQDEVRLAHQETPPNYNGYPLRGVVGGAFIVGLAGLDIPGYSDDATIIAGYILPTDPDARATEILRIRQALTANRVLVSFKPGGDVPDSPLLHDYMVTYVVTGDTGVRSIHPGPISYLVLGDSNFVYDEETTDG